MVEGQEFVYWYINFKIIISNQMIRDVKEIKESTLWQDTGRQIAQKNKPQSNDRRKIVVFVVGNKFAGKSSLIKVLKNDFDPQTKQNNLIQYWPSKIGKDKKQLVNFYEIGNKRLLQFMQCFKKEQYKIYCLICVDLTQAHKLIPDIQQCLKGIRQIFGKYSYANQQEVRRSHGDNQFIEQIPIKTCLVGCKFDQFEKMDLQSKKWISRSLRYVAHTNSCSILTCSNKNNQLCLSLRSIFNAFLSQQEMNFPKSNKDINKPLMISFGEDNIGDMNLPSSGTMSNIQVLQKNLQNINKSQSDSKPKGQKIQYDGFGRLQIAIENRRKQLLKALKKQIVKDSQSREEIELV